MAVIKCHECGKEVSTAAANCPHCGAPPDQFSKGQDAKQKTANSVGSVIAVLLVMITVVAMCSSDGDKKNESKPTSANCAKDDLQCQGERGLSTAHVYCKSVVEHLAKNSVKWTDEGMFEQKFSRFRWQDQSAGIIQYFGDKAQFQNGFGAYVNVVYSCDVDVTNQKALRAEIVKEGFLSP